MDKYGWRAARRREAFLALEDGSIFSGYSIGADRDGPGEAVFNTGMTGYQEILSDPSYAGQFVCLTAPEIGNVGVNAADMESRDFFAAGLVVHRHSAPSNWRSEESLTGALKGRGTPAIAGVDTRALATALRDKGAMKSYLCVTGGVTPERGVAMAREWEGMANRDFVVEVSCRESYMWDSDNSRTATYPWDRGILPPADYWVVAYDFGIKWNILRNLRRNGIGVKVVSAATPAADVLELKPDGVFLSNGPGDPARVEYAARAVNGLLGKVPILGICLGHQLLGMALGGKTYKLPFGHHGCNHPVKDLFRDRTLITSQNHNYALDPDSLPANQAEVTHISLNDNSVEGLRAKNVPAFSVQYHPEAAPGPHDAEPVFKTFRDMLASR